MTEERNPQPEEPTDWTFELTPEYMERCEALAAQRREMGVMLRERWATPEEDTCERFIKDSWKELTEPARTMIEEAYKAAYGENLVFNYCFHPEEYEEAAESVYHAALEITKRDYEILARIWRLALAAAASIDPADETPAGHRVNRGDVHRYYRRFSGMIEDALQEMLYPDLRTSRVEQARRALEAWEERVEHPRHDLEGQEGPVTEADYPDYPF